MASIRPARQQLKDFSTTNSFAHKGLVWSQDRPQQKPEQKLTSSRPWRASSLVLPCSSISPPEENLLPAGLSEQPVGRFHWLAGGCVSSSSLSQEAYLRDQSEEPDLL